MSSLAAITALAVYIAIPFGMNAAKVGLPYDMAFELMAMVILLLAARLAIAIANSALLIFLPMAFLAGATSRMLLAEIGLATPYDLVAGSLLTVLIGFGAQGFILKLTANWRQSALIGFSLTFGILTIAIIGEIEHSTPANHHYLDMVPAGIALFLALCIQIVLARSTGLAALAAVAQDKSWGDTLGVPKDQISSHLLLITGIMAGLAAIPLLSAEIAQSPDRWPGFWLGITAIVILTGRHILADTLWLALFVLVVPRLVNIWLPALPDMVMPTVILAVVLATLSHRGARPGEMAGHSREQPSS